ncbi:MAG TPA: phospholipase [Actinotalea sp.]|jgi:phospholipase/carboxylesterase
MHIDDAVTVRGGRAAAPGRPLLLLLHGYGSNEQDLAGLGASLPGWSWASVRAPLTLGRGAYAWFPVTTPGSPDPSGVGAGTQALLAWVDATVEPGRPVVPIGFSQGGVMASQLLRAAPERVPTAAILAGFVLPGEQPGDAVLAAARPPVFYGRGDADRVIAGDAVARTDAWLPGISTPDSHVYPGLGHGISAAMLEDLASFLARSGVA